MKYCKIDINRIDEIMYMFCVGKDSAWAQTYEEDENEFIRYTIEEELRSFGVDILFAKFPTGCEYGDFVFVLGKDSPELMYVCTVDEHYVLKSIVYTINPVSYKGLS